MCSRVVKDGKDFCLKGGKKEGLEDYRLEIKMKSLSSSPRRAMT
jgi:hypothetical protein